MYALEAGIQVFTVIWKPAEDSSMKMSDRRGDLKQAKLKSVCCRDNCANQAGSTIHQVGFAGPLADAGLAQAAQRPPQFLRFL